MSDDPNSSPLRNAPNTVPVLHGEAIAEAAIGLANGQPLHYREWFSRLHKAGYAVSGTDPYANFLANLQRHPLVLPCGDCGRGYYRVRPGAEEWSREAVKQLRQELAAAVDDPERRNALFYELLKAEKVASYFDCSEQRPENSE